MIEQPTSIPLSKELNEALEKARNNVSLLEADSSRLGRLITTQNRELISQETSKQYLEDEIKKAETHLRLVSSQVSIKEQELTEVTFELNEKEEIFLKQSKVLSERELVIETKKQLIHEREEKLLAEIKDFDKKKQMFLEDEIRHLGKVEMLKEVISKL